MELAITNLTTALKKLQDARDLNASRTKATWRAKDVAAMSQILHEIGNALDRYATALNGDAVEQEEILRRVRRVDYSTMDGGMDGWRFSMEAKDRFLKIQGHRSIVICPEAGNVVTIRYQDER